MSSRLANAEALAADLSVLARALLPNAASVPNARELLLLSSGEQRMMRSAVDTLARLFDGEITGLQAIASFLHRAEEIADGDGGRFVALLSFALSDRPTRRTLSHLHITVGAMLVGIVAHPIGSLIERLYAAAMERLGGSSPETGFHGAVSDRDPASTLTHHFVAFLAAGFHFGQAAASALAAYHDTVEDNPGDVRNGLFASMIGAALADHRLTPQQATSMVEWAFDSANDSVPWGLAEEDYRVEDWLVAMQGRDRP